MSESQMKYGVTPFSFEPTPGHRQGQEMDQKSEADSDDASLAKEMVPAPSYTTGGISHGPIGSSWHYFPESNTSQEIDRQGARRQERPTYPDVITIPTLGFAYPARASAK